MVQRSTNTRLTPNTLMVALAVVATLYLAKDVLLPLALAVLLTFVLVPLVGYLERLRLGRVPSVVLVSLLVFGLIASVGWVMTVQVVDLAENLPNYKQTLVHRVHSLEGVTNGSLNKASETIEEIRDELINKEELNDSDSDPAATAEDSAESAGEEAVPVTVVEVPPSPLTQITTWLGPLFAPLSVAALVSVFVIFMLVSHEDLRDRIIYLIGRDDLHTATQGIEDAGRRVGRYLRAFTTINCGYGLVAGIGLYLLGVPNAALWGALGAMLRFLPYVGPWLSATMPVLLSLAVYDGWLQPALAVGMFIVLELSINLVFEPWLYGKSVGVSQVGIITSAVFWAWLWGPEGLLLSVPLTVGFVVLAKHVPQVAFIETLLGDQPVLPLEMRFYQRLLALDDEEAEEIAEVYLRRTSNAELYNSLLIPSLCLAERDRHAGILEAHRQQFIIETTRGMVEELDPRMDPLADKPERTRPGFRVLCVPANDESDEVAAMMVNQLLLSRGYDSQFLSHHLLAGEIASRVEASQTDLVIISGVPPMAAQPARYLCKRIRTRTPDTRIVVGLWGSTRLKKTTEQRLTASGANHVVAAMSEAIDLVAQAASLDRPRDRVVSVG